MIGPPMSAPSWLRCQGVGILRPVSGLSGEGRLAATALSRNKPKASPWKALVPDFVVTFTAPDEVRSLERSKAGLRQRKLLNRAGRDVFSRRADGLAADVTAIDCYTSRSAEPAAE